MQQCGVALGVEYGGRAVVRPVAQRVRLLQRGKRKE